MILNTTYISFSVFGLVTIFIGVLIIMASNILPFYPACLGLLDSSVPKHPRWLVPEKLNPETSIPPEQGFRAS